MCSLARRPKLPARCVPGGSHLSFTTWVLKGLPLKTQKEAKERWRPSKQDGGGGVGCMTREKG